ncbi:cyclic nucleotide-binding and patatin-like phospholipase domain-containing protein [Niveibacterium umoris]|uniref:NTE family protein n=1 Tax=Niveibacterium umoris TaxID=1193620 RepID=A0A840BJD1_9RHOO|nr:patatin-like phospholipase family protein [Niveibacterium umoris]MBB4011708.1 NTE family protein [Niveibacterium umoris]
MSLTSARAPHLDPLLARYLHYFLGEIEPAAMSMLLSSLTWIELAGGETLMVQGEPGDTMYLSVSGRLRAYVTGDDGVQRMVREMGRGQIIGEMSLYTDAPRSATVVAVRDSVLVRLDKSAFLALLGSSPQLSLALTRRIILRFQTERQRNPLALPVTIGLFPVTAGIDLAVLGERLAAAMAVHGKVRWVDAATIDRELGETGAANGRADDAQLNRRIATLIDEIEADSDFVLLVSDATATAWTQRCSRHSDEILLFADASQPIAIHPIESACLDNRPQRAEAAQILVLLHAADSPCPRATGQWLARRPVADHVHVRPTLERDIARLARIQARKAVGLVLAGGGARGFAHLGIVRALQERGVEIDCVGGTSMGAVMATLVASDLPLARATEIARRAFRTNPTGDFNWLPMLSLIKGRRLRGIISEAMQQLFGGEIEIEDLWKNAFCVATNYSQAREQPLFRGSLSKSLRASIAIPGALPPVIMDGDLLCDGGTFNNFPVDVMQRMRGVVTVIGVDLNFKKPRRMEFDEVPGTWALLRDRLVPRAMRRYRLPSLSAYLMNVTILYSMSRQGEAQRMTDLYFNPPLERVGLLQWSKFDQIVEQGYAYAVAQLEAEGGAALDALHGTRRAAARPT